MYYPSNLAPLTPVKPNLVYCETKSTPVKPNQNFHINTCETKSKFSFAFDCSLNLGLTNENPTNLTPLYQLLLFMGSDNQE